MATSNTTLRIWVVRVLNFSQGLENASFDALKPLEMDFGELSFNGFVKDINEIGMRLVAEKVGNWNKKIIV